MLFYTLFPYYWAFVSSTKQGAALYHSALMPAFDFTYYRQLIDNPVFMGSLLNSAYVAVSTTLLSLVIGLSGRLCARPHRLSAAPAPC